MVRTEQTLSIDFFYVIDMTYSVLSSNWFKLLPYSYLKLYCKLFYALVSHNYEIFTVLFIV